MSFTDVVKSRIKKVEGFDGGDGSTSVQIEFEDGSVYRVNVDPAYDWHVDEETGLYVSEYDD